MNKYEQLIEHIINDETDKARELFHTIVVEKSRDIYENLIDEQDLGEVGGNQVEDLVDEITIDEQGMTEEEEGSEEDAMDAEEMPSEEDHDEAEMEDRVVDLEDALDELKAEFDALMAGEESEEQMMPGMHGDKDADEMEGMMMSDMHTGEMEGMDHKMHSKKMHGDSEMEGMDHKMHSKKMHSDTQMYEEDEMEGMDKKMHSKKMYEKEEDKDDLDETFVREYVEKVAAPSNTEGADNKQSIVAKKNDMGGSSANIVKGGEETGSTAKKPMVNNMGNINVPGGKAGSAYAKKETAVKTEIGGVNKTSPLAK